MNIELDLFRTRGRSAKPLNPVLVRELDETDLLLLREEKGSRPPALRRLSERHHNLARTLASGRSPGEAAAICRYNISRVSILLQDPAFQELLEFYRNGVVDKFLGLHEQMGELASDAAEELRQRLEDEPDKITTNQLMEVIKLGADRTGHGPATTSTNVNVNVDLAGRLEAARRRIAERKLLEHKSDG